MPGRVFIVDCKHHPACINTSECEGHCVAINRTIGSSGSLPQALALAKFLGWRLSELKP